MPRQRRKSADETFDEMDYGEWHEAPHELEGAPPSETEVVHWMAPRPVRVKPSGVATVAAVSFVAGMGAAVVTLALMHWLGPERELVIVKRGRDRDYE